LNSSIYSLELKNSITQLGSSYRALGLWNEALDVFDKGLCLCQENNDTLGTGQFLIWKSNVYYHFGFYGRAIELASKAIEINTPIKARANWISYYLGKPFLMLGDIDRYVRLQNEAVNLIKNLDVDELSLPWFLSDLAEGLNIIGDSEKAYAIIVEQVGKFKSMNQIHGIPYNLLILGKILLKLNQPAESKEALSEALSYYEKMKRESFIVDTLVELSKVELSRNNICEAKSLADKAIEEARKGPRETEGLADKRHLNGALVNGSRVHFLSNETQKAFELFKEAMSLAIDSNRKLMLQELSEIYRNAIG
jgi:tetratricopeptide (TPR) repeat protein